MPRVWRRTQHQALRGGIVMDNLGDRVEGIVGLSCALLILIPIVIISIIAYMAM